MKKTVKNKIADNLALAFKSHDIECISHGDYFEVDNGKMWIRPDVYIKHEELETSSVVLELVITSQLLGNRQIQEAFAYSGERDRSFWSIVTAAHAMLLRG